MPLFKKYEATRGNVTIRGTITLFLGIRLPFFGTGLAQQSAGGTSIFNLRISNLEHIFPIAESFSSGEYARGGEAGHWCKFSFLR